MHRQPDAGLFATGTMARKDCHVSRSCALSMLSARQAAAELLQRIAFFRSRQPGDDITAGFLLPRPAAANRAAA